MEILIIVPQTYCLSWWATCNSLFMVFKSLTGMCLCFSLYEFCFCWVSWPINQSFSWICGYWPLFFQIKYLPYFKSLLLLRLLWHDIRALYIVPEISKALFIFLQSFFSFSDWIICIDLSLGPPIPSISNRLLIQCSQLFISVVLFSSGISILFYTCSQRCSESLLFTD